MASLPEVAFASWMAALKVHWFIAAEESTSHLPSPGLVSTASDVIFTVKVMSL
jgi:hypothetical protein